MAQDRLNRSNLIRNIAQNMNVSETVAQRFYDVFWYEIFEAVRNGKTVSLSGIGTFRLQQHKGHPVQFQTSKAKKVDSYVVFKFSASKHRNKDFNN